MDFNPMMAPPPMAAAPAKKGGNTTLYIVIFFLCVNSVMAGTFYFQTQSAAAKAKADLEKIQADTAAKMAAAQSDFEKQQIQAEAAEKTRSAQLRAELAGKEAALKAKAKGKEAQLKALEAKVNADLRAAAKTVKNANNLKAKAANERNAAIKRLREANAAKAKAVASGKAIDKKLADEKAKLARDAAAKVAVANKKAADAVRKASAEARNARNIKRKLDKANITLKGNANQIAAAKYNAVPGYQIPGRKGKGNKFNVSGPNVCMDEAKKLKANVWGYRNNTHPNKKYKKSCFFYGVPSGNTFSGLKNDSIHMIGCAYGGNPRTGCDSVPKATVAVGKGFVGTVGSGVGIVQKKKDKKVYLYRRWGRTRKRYCYKTGNDVKCSSGNTRGSNKKFIIRSLGGGKVALKVKGKWCADEGDKVKCNRSAIGGWEKFTIKQHGGGFKLKGGKNAKWCRRVSDKIRCDRKGESNASTFYTTKR